MTNKICNKVKYWFVFILLIHFVVVGCTLEGEYDLGNRYYLLGDEANTVIAKSINGKRTFDDVILGEIVDYDFDIKFILVLRNASENAKFYFENHPLWNQQQGKDSVQLWIINKIEGTIYGPLELSEYTGKRKKLNIPETLKVKVNL